MNGHENRLLVAAFYKFIPLEDYWTLRPPLLRCCHDNALHGTILLAAEGINGTVVGTEAGIRSLFTYLHQDPRLTDLVYQRSYVASPPFHRLKVKLKKEIVTMGKADVAPAKRTGIAVEPADWNHLICADEVLVLDTRNHYEYAVGTFVNAISPNTTNFREFPGFVEQQLDPTATVAMFCTGGVRCEKASAWLLHKGFKRIYQLAGGILNYLKHVPSGESLWRGECFVFDNRVTVDHELEAGSCLQCYACRRPLCAEDSQSVHYQAGISCPYCYDKSSEVQKSGFAERRRQVRLAGQRRIKHIGAKMPMSKQR